jgi:hypothetical protein
MTVFMFGKYHRLEVLGRPVNQTAFIGSVAICVLVFAAIWLLNVWGARRLQKRIDELDFH